MWTELYIKKPKYDLSVYEAGLEDKVSDDKELLYNDKEHTYRYIGDDANRKGVYYNSVTGVIKSFLPKFSGSTENAQRKMCLTDAQVREVWNANRDCAGNRGTFIHAHLELMLTKANLPPNKANDPKYFLTEGELSLLAQADDEVLAYRREVKNWLKELISDRFGVGFALDLCDMGRCEKILHSYEYGIGGQCDYMLSSMKDYTKASIEKNETYMPQGTDKILIDWKTNSKSLTKPYGFFKHPFTKIQNTLLNKFSFQLAIYALMEEEMTGEPVNEAYVVHLIDGKVVPHEVNLDKFKPLAMQMLEYYSVVKK